LHQRLATTTVYVTHDQIEAMTMADKIVVMRDGHIAQMGAPLDLYDRPANTFVAGFIGSPAMNLITGTVTDDGMLAAGSLLLPMPQRAGLVPGRRLTWGVRPEHLALVAEGIVADVAVVEPTGSETHLILRASGQELVAVSRDRVGLRPGDRAHLRPDLAHVHLFDGDTGNRIED
jgi:multiple sugar transport system ATP-binding protein